MIDWLDRFTEFRRSTREMLQKFKAVQMTELAMIDKKLKQQPKRRLQFAAAAVSKTMAAAAMKAMTNTRGTQPKKMQR